MFDKQKKLNKIFFNVETRKTIFFRRNLHINNKATNIKICRVKHWGDLYEKKEGFGDEWLTNNMVFFLYHQSKQQIINNLKKIKTYNCDIVLTNCTTNEIVAFYPDLDSLQPYGCFYNVWVFERNKKVFLDLKLKDIVFTR